MRPADRIIRRVVYRWISPAESIHQRRLADALLEVRLNPHIECRIEPLEVADRDRAQFLFVARPEHGRIEGHRSGQVGNVLLIDRAVSAELGEGQVVGIEHKEGEMSEVIREEGCQPVAIRLGEARDRDVLEVPCFWASEEPGPASRWSTLSLSNGTIST